MYVLFLSIEIDLYDEAGTCVCVSARIFHECVYAICYMHARQSTISIYLM